MPVTLAIMGVNGRGKSLAQGFAALPDAQLKYVCDVDPRVIPKVVEMVASKQGKRPEALDDFRRILDDKGVDGLIVATPDHWHALATILACQAGKDVYVEKPCSHNVVEGRRMIEAARNYNRVVQVGTQRRSSPFFQDVELSPVGQDRQDSHGQGAQLPEAQGHRPRLRRAPPPASTTTSGSARPPCTPSTPTGSTTTGTGSGTTAPATSATTASTTSTWPAGASAWTPPPSSPRRAASTPSATTSRPPTPRSPPSRPATPCSSTR